MEWNWLTAGDGIIAAGAENVYLVSYQAAAGDISGVRLTRYRAPNAVASAVAQEAALNTIVFPLGRGPGRPAGSLELHALTAMAKDYADQYEAGSSLPGYPAWQHTEPVRPQSTDWAWADGTPLPADRWPPADYHGPLYLCEPRGSHAAHWIPPTPYLNDGARSWCPGIPEPGTQVAAGSSLPGHPAWQQLASAPPESAAVHLTEQPSAGYPAVMLFIGTGPARKRFSCPRCRVTVFTRASLASAQYICNGCGAQYEGTPLPGDTPAGTDPYAITYLGGGADGCRNC